MECLDAAWVEISLRELDVKVKVAFKLRASVGLAVPAFFVGLFQRRDEALVQNVVDFLDQES